MTPMLKSLAWSALLLFALPLAAAPKAPSVGRLQSFPELGLTMRIFNDAEARPLQTINRINVNGMDIVGRDEWFMHDQCAGIWRGPGSAIVTAKVSRLYPEFKGEAGPEALLEKSAPEKESMTEAELDAYVGHFAGAEPTARTWLKNAAFGHEVCRYDYEIQPDGSTLVGYLATAKREPGRRFLALYRFDGAMDRKRALNAARVSFATLEFKSQQQAAPAAARSKERRPYKREGATTAAFEASRERVINNIRNYRNWWYQETENFIVVSNMESNRNVTLLLDTLEKCRGAYQAYFPLKLPTGAICTVRLFEKREEYVAYVGPPMGETTGGIWMPVKLELAVSPLEGTGNQSRSRLSMDRIIRHEAFHQYIHFAVGGAQNAMWFNEGSAKYFEGLDVNARNFTVALTDELEQQLAQALTAGRPDFKRLIELDYEGFYHQDTVSSNYALAGGLIYFLYKSGNPDYRQVPDLFYTELIRTRDWRKATAAAWKEIDLRQFTDDFLELFAHRGRIRQADRRNPLRGK